MAAHPLALDRPRGVRGEDDAVILVSLVDDAARVVLDEMAGHVEVVGGQVRETVRGHLVGHGEHITHVLDRQVPVLLGVPQERDGRVLGHQHRGREVVGLHPLAQEVGEILGSAVAEDKMTEGLQQDRPRSVHSKRLLAQVDPLVSQVGDRTRRPGQILDVADREAVVRHD